MRKGLILAVLLVAIIIHFVKAQTELEAGEISLQITPIVLENVSDYTKTPKLIGLFGNQSYLMISWNAYYYGGVENDIAVLCYLNCFNLTNEDLTSSCNGIQNCSYIGLPGIRSCTILNPNYLYNQTNTVACKFYNPYSDIVYNSSEGKPYIARNFSVINYTMKISTVKVTVGEEFSFPIKITNYGLLESVYEVNLTPLTSNVNVKDGYTTTDSITYGETTTTYPKILFLVAQNANFKLRSRSFEDRFYCLSNNDCSYLNEYSTNGICIENSCYKERTFQIEAGKMALPDFSFYQVLLLLPFFVATYIFISKGKK